MPLADLPYYSIQPGRDVYHDHANCTEGNNIEVVYKRWGRDGRKLCKHCERLTNEEVAVANVKRSPLLGGLGLLGGPTAAFLRKSAL